MQRWAHRHIIGAVRERHARGDQQRLEVDLMLDLGRLEFELLQLRQGALYQQAQRRMRTQLVHGDETYGSRAAAQLAQHHTRALELGHTFAG